MDEVGESLWPPVTAVLAFLAINVAVRVTIPAEGVFRAPWLTPALEVLVLIVLVTHRPTSERERRRLRRLALALVGLLVAAALWATGVLVSDLVRGVGVC
jgi:hypothetical protein